MKKIITLLVLVSSFYMSTNAQCDKKWRDEYTNSFTNCVNPLTFYSTSTYTKDFSSIQGSCTICVPSSPTFGLNFPLQKTYVFSIVKVEANGTETIVGSINKSNLTLKYPDDFQPFINAMTSGQHRIKLEVKIHNQWNTPHDPSYQAKLNGAIIKTVANIEADSASRNFTLPIGTIDCFNFFKCFSATLSIPQINYMGQPTKVTATTNIPGSYSYYWIVNIDSNDAANNCVKGSAVYQPTSRNYINIPCSPCITSVQCGIVDNNNTSCIVNTIIRLGRRPCITKAEDSTLTAGSGASMGKVAMPVEIKSLPGKQLVIENLPTKSLHTIKLVDYNGNLHKVWKIEQTATRLFIENAEPGKLYVVLVEKNGKIITRKNIVIQ